MALQAGIVGLPNVGKSTLFNALTAAGIAESANYPFCTIEPNVGVGRPCPMRGWRPSTQSRIDHGKSHPRHSVQTGGHRWASYGGRAEGEGLGNKFLSQHPGNVDAIVHVVRCVRRRRHHPRRWGTVDPIRDIENDRHSN